MYEKVEKLNKAEEYFRKAYDSNPYFMEGLIEYVNFAIKIKNFDEASRLVEGFKGKEDHRFFFFRVGSGFTEWLSFQVHFITEYRL